MKMKIGWKIGGIVLLVAIIAMGTVGIAYAAKGDAKPAKQSLCDFSWVEPNDNGTASTGSTTAYVDPGDNGYDPSEPQTAGVPVSRFDRDFASTTAAIDPTGETMTVTIADGYPGYYPTIFFGLSNQEKTPGIVDSIVIEKTPADSPQFDVTLKGIGQNQVIDKGKEALGELYVSLIGPFPAGAAYSFTVSIIVTQYTHKGKELTVETTSLPRGEAGVLYSKNLKTKDGTKPFTWTITDGSLPDGLSLSDSGVISGTPTLAGTYSFTVQVVDSDSDSAVANLSITVDPAPAITTHSLPKGKIGKAYSETLAAKDGTAPYTWLIAIGSLPDGLSLSADGVISGTPTVKGNFGFTVRVTDSVGGTAIKSLSIKID